MGEALDGIVVDAEVLRMTADPFDCGRETVLEGNGRAPVEETFGFGVVCEEKADFAFLGSDARGVGFGNGVGAGELADDFEKLTDGDFAPGAEVNGLASNAFGDGASDEGIDGVRDKVEVAARREAAEADGFFAGDELADDGGDDRAGGLARAEGVERACGDDIQAEGEVERLGEFIGGDF